MTGAGHMRPADDRTLWQLTYAWRLAAAQVASRAAGRQLPPERPPEAHIGALTGALSANLPLLVCRG